MMNYKLKLTYHDKTFIYKKDIVCKLSLVPYGKIRLNFYYIHNQLRSPYLVSVWAQLISFINVLFGGKTFLGYSILGKLNFHIKKLWYKLFRRQYIGPLIYDRRPEDLYGYL